MSAVEIRASDFGLLADCIQHSVPALDGGLQIDNEAEDAAPQRPREKLGEVALRRIEPRARGLTDLESDALMARSQARVLGC